MAKVWLYASLGKLVGVKGPLAVSGDTIGDLIDGLESAHPGMKDVLSYEGGIMPGLAVVVDGETGNLGLLERVREDSEVHFLPAIGGGG
ncbi:MAG: MoaD/ThiS family protein [Chloroflexi bacterium]|nr:MoaD/ThiS family protein [Chloroflexota bacterium]